MTVEKNDVSNGIRIVELLQLLESWVALYYAMR